MKQRTGLLRAALRSLSRNRTRSLLTSLGIIIGVSAVIVMVAIGQGSQTRIQNEIASLGTNLIVVFPASSRQGGVSQGAGSLNQLTLADAQALSERAALITGASPVVRSGGQIIGGGNNWSTSVYGVTPEYFAIRDWTLSSGALFTARDVQSNRKVAVLGKTVVDELFGGQDPVGQTVRIRNTPFKVVGVLQEKGQNAMGMDQDDVVIAPSTTVLHRLKGGQYIDLINASAVSDRHLAAAQAEIRSILREEHHLREGEDDPFSLRNQAELTEAVTATSRVLTLLLGSIAAVSLLVGGIGIMNIMLVSVTERTREIGIRRSVGARSRDILVQFLTEAVVLSLAGGLLGIALAFAAAWIVRGLTDIDPIITPQIVALSFSFAGTVGVCFGFFPARKAAGLDPIQALRYE